MAWTVSASVKAVAGKTSHGDASLATAEPMDAAGGRISVLVEMEAGFRGTVEISTDLRVQDVHVEVHLSDEGGSGADA